MCMLKRFSPNGLQPAKSGSEVSFLSFVSSSPLTSSTVTRFRKFSIVLPKTELFMSLKKSFSFEYKRIRSKQLADHATTAYTHGKMHAYDQIQLEKKQSHSTEAQTLI